MKHRFVREIGETREIGTHEDKPNIIFAEEEPFSCFLRTPICLLLAFCRIVRIVAVDFDAGGYNIQESAIVKGKKKKGAMQLQSSTVLCQVTTMSGKLYKVG